VFWTSSKSGSACVSCSTDGSLLFWDVRKLARPTDTVILSTAPAPKSSAQSSGQSEGGACVLGASSLEYNPEAGASKFLVGTEQGAVLQVNLRSRKAQAVDKDKQATGGGGSSGVSAFELGPSGRHLGAVKSVHRNPAHPKFFLTVGDWSARVWSEDVKTPLMSTKYHEAYLTSGQWSPTRPGVFFVTRSDGVLDVWDYFYRQNEAACSYKVGGPCVELTCVGVAQHGGRLLCVGDNSGDTHLLEVSNNLAVAQANERLAVGNILERELKQEKGVEAREREAVRAKALDKDRKREAGNAQSKSGVNGTRDKVMEAILKKADSDFMALLKSAEDKDEVGS